MNGLSEKRGTTLTIQVPEELDHHTAEKIRTEADLLLKTQDIQNLVFDFSRTAFCDSSGIGMLMGRYKIMHALGGRMRAVHVNETVCRILKMSGMTKLILVEED